MFRVLMPIREWIVYDKLLAATMWCEDNIGPSKYPHEQAWERRHGVDKYSRPVCLGSKTPSDGIFMCFAFERKADATWFKMVWG